jgi:hypothetical protein
MTGAKKLILKSGVVVALGLAWLGTKPQRALAMDGACGDCVLACPQDLTLYCFEECDTDLGGSCDLVTGCGTGLAVICNMIQ